MAMISTATGVAPDRAGCARENFVPSHIALAQALLPTVRAALARCKRLVSANLTGGFKPFIDARRVAGESCMHARTDTEHETRAAKHGHEHARVRACTLSAHACG